MLSSFCTIGGATAAEGNVISGNTNLGIILSNFQNTVSNNFIGTAADGITPLGNGSSGMRVVNALNSSNGGRHLISNNIIANSSREGISFFPTFIPTIGNNISANSIYNNGVVFLAQSLAIDLDDNGITPNDAGDADIGANNLQNFPVLTSATVATTTTNILGTLNSEAGTSYRIEFFANLTDKREGKTFLGFQNVTTNGSGDAAINATFSVVVFHGQFVTATATRTVAPLDTSEFSAPIAATVQTFIVTNTNNSGTGSLRQAITDANANANPNLITFAITPLDGSVKTINLTSPLPTITNPLGIDGLTQNSATCDAPKVELNGTSAGAGGDGFTVTANNFLLQGFVINRFPGDGIVLDSNNTNTIRCNKIGTNATGSADLGNGASGIFLDTSSLNLIEQNTISGNGLSGIRGSFAQFNTIQSNIIGLSSDGTTVITNVQGGIVLLGGVSNIIGGAKTAKRNVVSGNGLAGIFLSNSASNSVKGNYIGVNSSGSGTTFGNTGAGIILSTSFADDNIIGGTEPDAGNIIAFNTTQGISLASTTGTGNRILSNLIHDNGSLGIDINADGVTANDSGDTDFGANNQQNFPIISAAETFFGGLKITGTLNSTTNTSFRIELFANPTCDSLGNGEGRIFVGAIDVTTNGSGNASFSQTFAATVALGETVSATATRNSTPFDTSEFSACRTVTTLTSFPTLTVTNTNDSGAGSLRQVITDANLSVSPDRIIFNIPGGGVKTIIPLGALPTITAPVVIDGLSQPGATCANPLIVLNGVSAGAFGNGLIITATAEITGLVINNFNANAIQFTGGDGNILKCNRIGIDATGLNSAPNNSGVLFQNTSNNTIGGTGGDGNLFTSSIALRFQNSDNNTIQGNIFGLDKNGQVGALTASNTVALDFTNSDNNLIGGTSVAARNIISRFTTIAISLSDSNQNNIKGNYIGVNSAGEIAGTNGNGIRISNSSDITIGGTENGAGNVISNTSTAIEVNGILSANAVIKGNLIGTNAAGTTDAGNSANGIFVTLGATATIGGRTTAERNVIAGNNNNGIRIAVAASGGELPNAIVEGNYIGLGADGTTIIGNFTNGVLIDTPGNQIGGSAIGARNVISGNGVGVRINTSNNIVQGNLIGTDAGGTLDKGNNIGVFLATGSANSIGGTTAATRNVISGNTNQGLSLLNATGNLILNNFIGLNANGTGILPNGQDGIFMDNSTGNFIGNSTLTGNVISGNGRNGIALVRGANNNFFQGNLIGTDVTGTIDLGNLQSGINIGDITPISTGNTIGGASPNLRNVISGNNNNGGIFLDDFATNTIIQSNLIGTAIDGTSALGNVGSGIFIEQDSNTIGGVNAGNTIAFNTSSGIVVDSTGTGNVIRANSIFSNGTTINQLGIDLGNNGVTNNDTGDGDLANNQQNFPVITDAGTNIVGTFNSTANATFTLDFYLNPVADTSNFGEGKTYLGAMNVTTNGSGNATFTFVPPITLPTNQFVVATATNTNGDTSEFSQNRQIAGPLAANVNIQGRVLSNDGRAISKATLTLVEPNGNIRYAMTNPFGYFQFLEVPAGETYTLNVSSKTYDFIPSVFIINLSEEINDFTIVGTRRENLNEETPQDESPMDSKKP